MAFSLKFEKPGYLGLPYWPLVLIAFAFAMYYWLSTAPELFSAVLLWLFIFSPFVLPPLLLAMLWLEWRGYVRAKYISEQTPILLEFKIPQHIFKTPSAMEQVFAGMHVGPGESTFIARWINGKVRPWWSFEIVSIEGEVHLYAWTWKQFRSLVETQFYSQYPDLEIHEVENYTDGVHFEKGKNVVFGAEFSLGKADAYPIKTYIDFELDRDSKKAEQIVDPISSVFEKLSAIGEGEQMWIQILIRQNKGATTRDVFWFGKEKTWQEEAQAEIDKIYEDAKPKKKASIDEEDDGYPQLKPAQINQIKALERSIDKPGFDAGIRGIYIAREGTFDGTRIAPFLSMWNSFNTGTLNKINPGGPWHTSTDYPWEDFGGRTSDRFSMEAVDAYRRRSFFHGPYERPRYVLTSEELATIFHFPSEEVKAPGVKRLSSTKSEPPTNLPI